MLASAGTVEHISPTHWHDADPCPDNCLCHAPTQTDIALQVAETRDNPFYRHGVYILECRTRSLRNAEQIAWNDLDISTIPYWVRHAANADRLLYVGLSQRMVTRIHNHAHGNGASFTTVFPPTRLLDIEWYPTLAHSYRAEEQTAEQLRDKFPDTYVSQPG